MTRSPYLKKRKGKNAAFCKTKSYAETGVCRKQKNRRFSRKKCVISADTPIVFHLRRPAYSAPRIRKVQSPLGRGYGYIPKNHAEKQLRLAANAAFNK